MSSQFGRWSRRRWWASQVWRRSPEAESFGARISELILVLELRQLQLQGEAKRLARVARFCRSCGSPISPRRIDRVRGAVFCTACALIARRSRNLLEPLARRN